jgi:hypothetical protein
MPRLMVWQAPAVPSPQQETLSLPVELSTVRPLPLVIAAQHPSPVAVSQKLLAAQVVLSVQAALQVPPSVQSNPFGQATPASATHLPSPSHSLVISVLPVHTLPQAVVAAG